jgi:hypothetical protein
MPSRSRLGPRKGGAARRATRSAVFAFEGSDSLMICEVRRLACARRRALPKRDIRSDPGAGAPRFSALGAIARQDV